MTLAPLENRRVRAVSAERYPLNPQCSNPECSNATDDPHHIFRRRAIGGDSWFVQIEIEEIVQGEKGPREATYVTLPHVTGMCRECHDKVTDHRFWIKLEGDEFVLYERSDGPDDGEWWRNVGPLSPQPGGRDKPARRRKRKTGEARATRATISLRVPETDERPTLAEQYDDLLPRVEALLTDPDQEPRSPIYTIVNALGYVLLNEGGPDA